MPSNDAAGSGRGHEVVDSAAREAPTASPAALVATPLPGAAWLTDDLSRGFLALAGGGVVVVNTESSTLSGLNIENAVGDGWWAAVHPPIATGSPLRYDLLGAMNRSWTFGSLVPRSAGSAPASAPRQPGLGGPV